jgi:hypothetical protein
MGLVVDVDAIAKLAHWRLLPELPALIGIPWNETSTVPSLRYRAQRALATPDGKLFRHTAAAQAAVAAIAGMRNLPEPDATILPAFQDVPDIDVGEAVLFAVLAKHSDEILFTGDKRALRALSRLPASIWSPLCGRIIALEEVVLKALETYGIDWLRERICPERELDKAIAIVLGNLCDAPADGVCEGLRSYIGELHALCTPSLLRSGK